MGKVMLRVIGCIVILFLMIIGLQFVYDDTSNLGSGYEYFSDSRFISGPTRAMVGNKSNYIESIPPRIIDYDYNNRHIIVKQNPNEAYLDPYFFPECDSLYSFDHGYDFDYYWIIDKVNHNIYGPYDIDVFKEKCDSLGVKLEFK